MSPNVGTPDWQRGVVSAQKLLASVAGGTDSVTVGVPPNAETVVIVATQVSPPETPLVRGTTSNFEYYPAQLVVPANVTAKTKFYVDVAAALDAQLAITFGIAPTAEWYVYSDSAVRVNVDAATVNLTQAPGFAPGGSGIMAMGSDGTDAHFLSTDDNGRLERADPNIPAGAVPLAATEYVENTAASGSPAEMLAAPSSGAWFLFSAMFETEAVSSPQLVLLTDGSGKIIVRAEVPPDGVVPFLFGPLRIASSVTMNTSAAVNNSHVDLFYAPGP